MTLSAGLRAVGRPLLDDQLAHPTVAGIAAGTLDDAAFRWWLEQDYLFLLDYVRVFARLAGQAPDAHVGDLVDLAHETLHGELDLHRSLAASFGADLEGATKGPACTAYTEFLLAAGAGDYGVGLAALFPCMWGYSTLGRLLPTPREPRYRRWVETYADPSFAALAQRCGEMLDEADPDPVAAETAFRRALAYELDFWDVP
ncbi:MAG: transcriptional regulator [Actinomycetota bacterium]|nr:transcriptional regulator [Actinomycetota bacterium]